MSQANNKPLSTQKAELRKHYLAVRHRVSGIVRQKAERDIVQHLCEFLSSIKSNMLPSSGPELFLGLYSPFRDEVDITPMYQEAKRIGWRPCVPKTDVEAKRMDFYVIPENPEWVSGPYGIRELQPTVDSQPIPSDALCAVIVPGLAFTENGWRLGYGGGYYDRLFAEGAKNVLKIGCGFDVQMADELPVLRFDVRMDRVITETRVITCAELH